MYVKQNEIMSYTVHSMDIFGSHLLHATCDFCFVCMFIYFARIALLLILRCFFFPEKKYKFY